MEVKGGRCHLFLQHVSGQRFKDDVNVFSFTWDIGFIAAGKCLNTAKNHRRRMTRIPKIATVALSGYDSTLLF